MTRINEAKAAELVAERREKGDLDNGGYTRACAEMVGGTIKEISVTEKGLVLFVEAREQKIRFEIADVAATSIAFK